MASDNQSTGIVYNILLITHLVWHLNSS
jgi:hypothetical protein